MPIIDYQQLQTQHKPKHHISQQANTIANQVINELYIQQGYGLAPFLGLDDSLDNHKAVRVWIQEKLDSGLLAGDDNEVVYQLINEITELCSFECAFN